MKLFSILLALLIGVVIADEQLPLALSDPYDTALGILQSIPESYAHTVPPPPPSHTGIGQLVNYVRYFAKKWKLLEREIYYDDSQLDQAIQLLETAWNATSEGDIPINDVNTNSLKAAQVLGDMHFFGNFSCPRDFNKALYYYESIAHTDPHAQFMTGLMYATGMFGNVPLDQAKAALYYEAAAQNGNMRAQMAVAYRKFHGIGTNVDLETAGFWYKQVADRAYEYYSIDESIPGPVKTRHIGVADDNAWSIPDKLHGGLYGIKPKVRQGDVLSDILISRGVKVDKYDSDDLLETVYYLTEENDSLIGHYALAIIYYEGGHGGVQRDYKRAVQEAFRGFDQIWDLHTMKRRKGLKVDLKLQDKTMATLAAACASFLGERFLRAEGVDYAPNTAVALFELAASYDDTTALYNLGVLHMNGYLMEQDTEQGLKYLEKAAHLGHITAKALYVDHYLSLVDYDLSKVAHNDVITQFMVYVYFSKNIECLRISALLSEKSDEYRNVAVISKALSEVAEDLHSPLRWAQDKYRQGDLESALLGFLIAAEQGYTAAETNVAYLLDHTHGLVDVSPILHANDWLVAGYPNATAGSLVYYSRAGKSGNYDAIIKMGDFYLAGQGVEASNPHLAAECYSLAAYKAKSSIAQWNIGWMHENGIGVAQDFYLAKRYYDLALESQPASYLAVRFALAKLYIRYYWDYLRGGTASQTLTQNQKQPLPLKDQIKEFWQKWKDMKWAAFYEEDEEDIENNHGWVLEDVPFDWLSTENGADDEDEDTVILVCLVIAVGLFLAYRLRDRRRNRGPNEFNNLNNNPNNQRDPNQENLPDVHTHENPANTNEGNPRNVVLQETPEVHNTDEPERGHQNNRGTNNEEENSYDDTPGRDSDRAGIAPTAEENNDSPADTCDE